jgi:7-carboxy-7-deazaguanine synthase
VAAPHPPVPDARRAEPWETARRRRLRVAELFTSLQGEGSRVGLPTVFVRLTGCALRCTWCDTAWAFHEGRHASLEEVERAVLAERLPRVCVTGGEPLLQPSVVPLVRRLVEEHRMDVVVETGGDQDISVLPAGAVRILDVKLPGSGMADRMDPANIERLTARDEVKMIVAGREDYEAARALAGGRLAGFGGELLLGAVHGCLDPAELARWVLEDRLRARVQLQLHKLLWPGRDKGV